MKKLNINHTHEELLEILRKMPMDAVQEIEEAVFAYEVLDQPREKADALLKKFGLTYDEWDYLGY